MPLLSRDDFLGMLVKHAQRMKAVANLPTYIPLHSVIRIDEVEKRGAGKIHDLADRDGKIHQLPTAIYTPVKKDS